MRSLRSQASSPPARATSPPMAAPASGRRTRTSLAMMQSGGGGGADASAEVRESIEAKPASAAAGDDVDSDADADADGEDDPDVEMADAADPGTASQAGTGGTPSRLSRTSRDLLQLIETTAQYLSTYEESGDGLAAGFQRLPNKRLLPDYFDVIKEPTAFSTIRGKVQKRQYTDFAQFVRDVTLICHNAQVYNRPSAPIFQEAVRLREVFKAKLQQLVKDGSIRPEDTELPDLGEIPDSPSGPDGDDNEEVEEEEEEEEEEDDDEDDDDQDSEDGGKGGRRKRGRGRGRGVVLGPPKIYTEMESRVMAVLKGLRKAKDEDGDALTGPFEELPDRELLPEYYDEIKKPMALDEIRRRARCQLYPGLEAALADLELMCNNAQVFNQDGSAIFEAAVTLQKLARQLVAQEAAKPADAYRDEHGRLGLPVYTVPAPPGQHPMVFGMGDWVHIRNPNDPRKPIVAQIFRLWADPAGVVWFNACWYYRPEQTVHRFDRHFLENEVIKTSQFRTHRIDELIDHCYVLHAPLAAVGRPRGYAPTRPLYVCAYRYNEQTFTFAKITSWDPCEPEAARVRRPPLDRFPAPRPLRKLPSPIKHLLRDDAKESDPPPKPTWGNPNAPPMIGAVHRRPRQANESPPPEPQLLLPEMQRPGDVVMAGTPDAAAFHSHATAAYSQQQFVPRPPRPSSYLAQHSPMLQHAQHQPPPPQGYNQNFSLPQQQQHPLQHPHQQPHQHHMAPAPGAPHLVPPGYGAPHQAPPPPLSFAPNPAAAALQNNNSIIMAGQPLHPAPPPALVAAAPFPHRMVPSPGPMAAGTPGRLSMSAAGGVVAAAPMSASSPLPAHQLPHQQHPLPQQQQQQQQQPPPVHAPLPPPLQPSGYIPPRPKAEAFVLPPDVDRVIPAGVRKHYHCDNQGRVVFFTSPSARHAGALEPGSWIDGRTEDGHVGVAPELASLGHSVRYLHGLDAFREERRRKRKQRNEAAADEARERAARQAQENDAALQAMYGAAGEALGEFVQWVNEGTRLVQASLDGWGGEGSGGSGGRAASKTTAVAAAGNQ